MDSRVDVPPIDQARKVCRQIEASIYIECSVAFVYDHMSVACSPSMGDVLSILGLRSPDTIRPAIGPLLHVIVLYAGPILFEFGIQRRDFGPIEAPRDSLLALRTLLFAPVVEEFVFRSCMAPLFIMAGWSKRGVVAVTPLMFGAAHLHHLHNLVTYEVTGPHATGRALRV